jgi:two-component system, OmpR family, sensor kinase
MFKTLYARLVFTLFVLFALMGAMFVVASMYSAHMYQQEVSQHLNRNLAMYIANERVLINRGRINQKNLENLFQQAMIINPSLELYLLDPNGKIISYSSHLHGVVRDHVSLQAIKHFFSTSPDTLVEGDDPKSRFGRKAFSVAAINNNGKLQGYIYAILGSEQYDHVTEMLKQSYIMQWSVSTIIVSLVFAFFAALMVFFLLTRKLRLLGGAMENFRQTDFSEPPQIRLDIKKPVDEIDHMSVTFQQMAERIYQQLTQLRETDALRRELVSNVSHDLRTPLSSLKGYLDTLLLKDESLSAADRRKYLQIAQTNTNRLSKLVVELFELAKLDANELKPSCEAFSITELIYDVAQKFELRANQKEVSIKVDAPSYMPYVYADVAMIERVLDNLIDNALRHTPPHGVISILGRLVEEQVHVSVTDTGCGISEHDLPHIFTRFYRQSSTTMADGAGSGSGAGLGLAIANRIVELHGSKLFVKSEPDQGTEFDFELPVKLSA